ncbi:MAG: serine/threonine-protein kinase [Myxococcota bacterium]
MSQRTEREDEWLDEFREQTDGQLGDAPPGFLLDELLGRGGMAEVYLAHRTGPKGFSRKVVIKRIRPDKVQEQDFVERFIREASLTSKFHHPNIVEILELVTQEQAYYIIMEYLHGRNVSNLIERLNRGGIRFPPDIAAYIVAGLASALHYAHNFMDEDGRRHQIVHRDISPDNVMVTYAGEVKLLDFGVAKDLDGTALTQGDKVIGKPLYLPPEALNGAPASPARDIYSLGMTLYVMLAGRPPFEMGSGPEGLARLLVDITNSEIPPLREFNQDVPDDLEHIVMRALSKEERNRYTAADMQHVLESYLVNAGSAIGQSGLAQFLRDSIGEEAEKSGSHRAVRSSGVSSGSSRSDSRSSAPKRKTPPPKRIEPDRQSGGWEAKRESRASVAPTAAMPVSPIPAAAGADAQTRLFSEEPPKRTAAAERKKKAKKAKGPPQSLDPAQKKTLIAGAGIAVAALLLFIIVALSSGDDREQEDFDKRVDAIRQEIAEQVETPPAVRVPTQPVSPTTTSPRTTAPAGRKNAVLAVDCNGTDIYVDGQLVGFCPSQEVSVTPGRHTIEVRTASGRVLETMVVVGANEVQRVSLKKPRRRNRKVDVILRPGTK